MQCVQGPGFHSLHQKQRETAVDNLWIYLEICSTILNHSKSEKEDAIKTDEGARIGKNVGVLYDQNAMYACAKMSQ